LFSLATVGGYRSGPADRGRAGDLLAWRGRDGADYCRHLVERFDADPRLQFSVAPLGPFLDPGSRAFEHPEQMGFRRRLITLADHRQALLGPTWQDMLSYEAERLTREQIVATTYEVGVGLNDVSRVLVRRLGVALARETGHAWSRYGGRDDTAIAKPGCLPLPPTVAGPAERMTLPGPVGT
jgi:hypothetical protein